VNPAFVLQAALRPTPQADAGTTPTEPTVAETVGLGFTASRRVGGAVQRNRAKRRLREAARLLVPALGFPGANYVLVARVPVLTCPFSDLVAALEQGLGTSAMRLERQRERASPLGSSASRSTSTAG
jgi:ribonuclease P protein component